MTHDTFAKFLGSARTLDPSSLLGPEPKIPRITTRSRHLGHRVNRAPAAATEAGLRRLSGICRNRDTITTRKAPATHLGSQELREFRGSQGQNHDPITTFFRTRHCRNPPEFLAKSRDLGCRHLRKFETKQKAGFTNGLLWRFARNPQK